LKTAASMAFGYFSAFFHLGCWLDLLVWAFKRTTKGGGISFTYLISLPCTFKYI